MGSFTATRPLRLEGKFMEYLIGVVLGAGTCVFARLTGFDRERVFYPMLLVFIATYYIAFAVMGRSVPALTTESLVAGLFFAVAVVGVQEKILFFFAALSRHRGFGLFLY